MQQHLDAVHAVRHVPAAAARLFTNQLRGRLKCGLAALSEFSTASSAVLRGTPVCRGASTELQRATVAPFVNPAILCGAVLRVSVVLGFVGLTMT